MSSKVHVSRRAFTTLLATVTLLLAASSGWAGGKAEAGKPVDKAKPVGKAAAAGAADTNKASAAASSQSFRLVFPKPGSHKGNWLRFHGSVAPLAWTETGQQGNSCQVCHARSDCINCHKAEPPRDHTNSWRQRAHGFEADADKERCETCHRQDMCVRCHNETPPRSHTASWTSDHCTWCHQGPGRSMPSDLACSTCHKTSPH